MVVTFFIFCRFIEVAILSSIVNGAYGLLIGVVIRLFSIKLGNWEERSGGITGHGTIARAFIYPSRSFMSMIPVCSISSQCPN